MELSDLRPWLYACIKLVFCDNAHDPLLVTCAPYARNDFDWTVSRWENHYRLCVEGRMLLRGYDGYPSCTPFG
jgi:hypothetical protein